MLPWKNYPRLDINQAKRNWHGDKKKKRTCVCVYSYYIHAQWILLIPGVLHCYVPLAREEITDTALV